MSWVFKDKLESGKQAEREKALREAEVTPQTKRPRQREGPWFSARGVAAQRVCVTGGRR